MGDFHGLNADSGQQASGAREIEQWLGGR